MAFEDLPGKLFDMLWNILLVFVDVVIALAQDLLEMVVTYINENMVMALLILVGLILLFWLRNFDGRMPWQAKAAYRKARYNIRRRVKR